MERATKGYKGWKNRNYHLDRLEMMGSRTYRIILMMMNYHLIK